MSRHSDDTSHSFSPTGVTPVQTALARLLLYLLLAYDSIVFWGFSVSAYVTYKQDFVWLSLTCCAVVLISAAVFCWDASHL